MKKLMLMMFILVILVGSVSASVLTTHKYVDDDLKVEFRTLGLIYQGDATLKSHSSIDEIRPIGYGSEQVVMYYDFNFLDLHESGLGEVEFIDKRTQQVVDKNYSFVYWGIETRIRNTFGEVCLTVGENKTNSCENKINGTESYEFQGWLPYNTNDIPNGDIRIGLKTYVDRNDHIDGVWTIVDEKISLHAEWTASLNVDLIDYYNFEDTSSLLIDVKDGVNNGTIIGTPSNVSGIIGNGLNFTENGDFINMTNQLANGSADGTVCMWARTPQGDINWMMGTFEPGTTGHFYMGFGGTGTTRWFIGGGASLQGNLSETLGDWNAFCFLWGTGGQRIFLNGTISASSADTQAPDLDAAGFYIGTRKPETTHIANITLDEIGVWARRLSVSEIQDFYNNGTGITFLAFSAPEITLNSPVNAFNTTNQTIDFNGTVTNLDGVINVTLFINGILNQTNSSGINDTDYLFTKTISDGDHNWSYESCNDNGCITAPTRTFTIDTITPNLNVTEPFGLINFQDISENQTLRFDVSNVNIDTCLFDYEGTNTTTDCSTNITNFTIGTDRTFNFWVNDTVGNQISQVINWSYLVLQTAIEFNSSSFETAEEIFTVDVTTNGSVITAGSLTFDGTENTGATITNPVGDNYSITKSIFIPTSIGTKTHNFNLTISSKIINTTSQTQIINATNFTICLASPNNVPFINITFKNETLAEENVNATISSTWTYSLGTISEVNKTLSFTDAVQKTNYTFCGNPADKTFNIILDMDFDNDISQQRSFSLTTSLTNATLSQVLYLLPTSLGLFSPFKTTNINGDTISFVAATITRVLGGSTITVGSGLTDSSGFATFFLNPNVAHIATFSKTGFANNVFTFVPTADLRTVVMGGGVSISNGTIISRGTTYVIDPKASTLANNTDFTFTFNVTSNLTSITLISMNITNSSNHELLFVSNAGVGNLSGTLNTLNNTELFGNYIIETGEETISVTRTWIIFTTFIGDYSIFRQLTLTSDFELIGDFNRLMLVLATIFGIIIFMNMGKVIETSESNIAVALLLIWGFSIVGWLDTGLAVSTTNSGTNRLGEFASQYGIAILMSSIAMFFILRRLFIRVPR